MGGLLQAALCTRLGDTLTSMPVHHSHHEIPSAILSKTNSPGRGRKTLHWSVNLIFCHFLLPASVLQMDQQQVSNVHIFPIFSSRGKQSLMIPLSLCTISNRPIPANERTLSAIARGLEIVLMCALACDAF